MAKAKKKSKAKKSKAKPAKKKAKKSVKRAAARAPAKTKMSKKVAAKAKKPAPKKAAKKKIVGEGDYAASRKFDKDQASFVKRNKAKIPALGKEAEAALDGSEGANLRAAEQEAINRSVIE